MGGAMLGGAMLGDPRPLHWNRPPCWGTPTHTREPGAMLGGVEPRDTIYTGTGGAMLGGAEPPDPIYTGTGVALLGVAM